jgi:hypothetical protein
MRSKIETSKSQKVKSAERNKRILSTGMTVDFSTFRLFDFSHAGVR